MIDADRVSDGLLTFCDLLPTALAIAGAADRVPTDRYIDGADQSSFLLAPDGASCRTYPYSWLVGISPALETADRYLLVDPRLWSDA